jgi:RHS repeat-associated protein
VLKETTGPNQQGGAPLLRATAATELNLRFPGQYFESEAGSFYNYFRSYQATTGRYTQADPIGLDGGWNRMAYVGANPLARFDATGLQATVPSPFGPVPVPVPVVPGSRGSSGGYDPRTDMYTPLPSPSLTDLLRNWMDARGQGDPARPPDVNPGRDCDGKCNPCPSDPLGWAHEGDAHGSTGGRHYHRWMYNQDPATCICRAGRRSGGMPL